VRGQAPSVSRLAVPRLLAAGTAVTASTAVRLTVGWAGVVAQRTPGIVQHAVGTLTGSDDGRSESALRDELIGLLRDSAEACWHELRRGVDEFDALTRGDEERSEASRPFRVKP